MNAVEIPICMLNSQATLPAYAYPGDAGMDLCSCEETSLKPFERKSIRTSLQIALPTGYAGLVLPRSGLSSKHGVTVINSPGLIDSNYRGEIQILLVNLDPHQEFFIKSGDRIAQLVVIETPTINLLESASLDSTERGSRGFGSSGI